MKKDKKQDSPKNTQEEVELSEESKTKAETETSSDDKSFKQLQKELEDTKNKYFRALADYQNLQRRTETAQSEARNRGVEDFLKNLLPVLDTLDKAVEQLAVANVDKSFADGFEMFAIQFSDMLTKSGVKEIPAIGKPFDPTVHEAMSHSYKEGAEEDEVIQIFVKGYTYKDRVLRTAKVVINRPQ